MEKTQNYSQFRRLGGNAPLNVAHLNQLMDAIDKKNLLEARPILVNENMEVVDGQHRLEAAKRLNLPIFFIKINSVGIDDIATLNSNQRNWKMEHYLNLYCDYIKNENYINFRYWLKNNDFSFTQGISFFIDESNINECRRMFKDGEFIFDEKYISLGESYKITLNKILSNTKGKSQPWLNQSFIRAFIVLCNNKEIDLKRLWEQLDKYPFLLSHRPSKQMYLELLYELYNYRRHIRVDA